MNLLFLINLNILFCNGTTLKNCRWGIGNVYFNYETIPDQFSNELRAFNTQNDTLGGFHEGLTGLAAFINSSFINFHPQVHGPAGGGQSVITEPVWANQGFSSYMDFIRLPSRSPHCADTSQIQCLKYFNSASHFIFAATAVLHFH